MVADVVKILRTNSESGWVGAARMFPALTVLLLRGGDPNDGNFGKAFALSFGDKKAETAESKIRDALGLSKDQAETDVDKELKEDEDKPTKEKPTKEKPKQDEDDDDPPAKPKKPKDDDGEDDDPPAKGKGKDKPGKEKSGENDVDALLKELEDSDGDGGDDDND